MSSICRLCLNNILETYNEFVDDECSLMTKVKLLIPEINIDITPSFNLCTNCVHSLNSAYSFKLMCLEIDELINKYATNTESVDLQYVRDQKFFKLEHTNTDVDIKTDSGDSIEDTTKFFEETTQLEDVKHDICLSSNYNAYEEGENQNNEDKSKIFKHQENLDLREKHLQSPNNSEEYTCDICTVTFKSYSLTEHTDRHVNNEKKYNICNICNKGYCSSDVYGDKELHTNREWICKVCGKNCSSSRYLRQHMRYVHVKQYVCNTCGIKCGNNYQLIEHTRTHTGERPYKCEYCGKGFAQNSTLRNHMKCSHNTEKPFVCETCGNTFTIKRNLKRHIATHLDIENNFICKLCNKAYRTKDNLRRHTVRHLKQKNHKCPVCVKEFFDATSLKQHLRVHTGDRPYECYTCHKAFSKKSNLQKHFRSHRKKGEVT